MSYFSKPTTPNGKLYIGNVKWSNDYKNVMLFASAEARDTFLKSHLTLIKSNVIFYNPNGYIDVKKKIENVESINYALYINDSDISDTSIAVSLRILNTLRRAQRGYMLSLMFFRCTIIQHPITKASLNELSSIRMMMLWTLISCRSR